MIIISRLTFTIETQNADFVFEAVHNHNQNVIAFREQGISEDLMGVDFHIDTQVFEPAIGFAEVDNQDVMTELHHVISVIIRP